MLKQFTSGLFILLLSSITAFSQPYPVKGVTKEVATYRVERSGRFAILHMAYASSIIQDPEVWPETATKITSIDVVFTAYPKNKADWITNYDLLLSRRIENIIALQPSLLSDPHIQWNFVLQTSCSSEEEAQRMFHGAVIHYIPAAPVKTGIPSEQQEAPLEMIYNEIEATVFGMDSLQDSVVFKTFERNRWNRMLIVNDWTGSMYPYGAQAVLWHRLNFDRNAVKYFIFFNDGNNKPDRLKRIGNTGGIYYARPDSIEFLLKVMKLVAKRGDGGDIPENNIEALLKGIRLFKGFDQLVMIADNHAGVRDMWLLDRVTIPVHIVLCGAGNKEPVHPHYLEIARRTGGSIHTIEEDIHGLKDLKEGEKVTIAGLQYILKKGKLTLSKQQPSAKL